MFQCEPTKPEVTHNDEFRSGLPWCKEKLWKVSVAPNCRLILFPQDVLKFEKPQFIEQIWKSPLLWSKSSDMWQASLGNWKQQDPLKGCHTNTFQLVNSILPASQAHSPKCTRTKKSNSLESRSENIPKTKNRDLRKKKKNIWGFPKMVGFPNNYWFSYIKMTILGCEMGVPPFLETKTSESSWQTCNAQFIFR